MKDAVRASDRENAESEFVRYTERSDENTITIIHCYYLFCNKRHAGERIRRGAAAVTTAYDLDFNVYTACNVRARGTGIGSRVVDCRPCHSFFNHYNIQID